MYGALGTSQGRCARAACAQGCCCGYPCAVHMQVGLVLGLICSLLQIPKFPFVLIKIW